MSTAWPRTKGPRVKRFIGSPLTMPPHGLNLDEYGTEFGVTAPQAGYFAFLSHKSVKISLVFLSFPICQAPWRDFRLAGGGGGNDILGAWGGMAPRPPLLDLSMKPITSLLFHTCPDHQKRNV